MGKVSTYYKGDMLFESQIGNHKVLVDVPDVMNGSDRAPTPPDYFVASLGSCVAAFVANYCQQVGLDPSGLRVDVTFDKAEDPTRLINLKVSIYVPNAEFKKREKAFMRVAGHCPVHETITTTDHIDFELVIPEE